MKASVSQLIMSSYTIVSLSIVKILKVFSVIRISIIYTHADTCISEWLGEM